MGGGLPLPTLSAASSFYHVDIPLLSIFTVMSTANTTKTKALITIGNFMDADGEPFTLEAKKLPTMHIRVFAQTGKGKSYVAGVLCEEMVDADIPFTVFDQQGHYWGLKQKYKIVLFGRPGRHGVDFPMPYPEKDVRESIILFARNLAEVVASSRQSVIVDLSGWKRYGQRILVTEYLNHLFAINPDHAIQRQTVIEEADVFAPLQPIDDISAFCEDAVENIARRGRGNGLGDIIVTQRPASISMNVRSQKDLVLVLNMSEGADLKAFQSMIADDEGFLTDEQLKMPEAKIKAEISRMARSIKSKVKRAEPGVAFAYSPSMNIRRFVQVRAKKTYHAGAAVGDSNYKDPRTVQVHPFEGQGFTGVTNPLFPPQSPSPAATPAGTLKNVAVHVDPSKHIPKERFDNLLREYDALRKSRATDGHEAERLRTELQAARAKLSTLEATMPMVQAELKKAKAEAEAYRKDHESAEKLREVFIQFGGFAASPQHGAETLKLANTITHVRVDDRIEYATFTPESTQHHLCVLIAKGFFDQERSEKEIHAEIDRVWGMKAISERPGGPNANRYISGAIRPALHQLRVIPFPYLEEVGGKWKAQPDAKKFVRHVAVEGVREKQE